VADLKIQIQLEILQLRQQLHQLEQDLHHCSIELIEAMLDRELLALVLCRTAEFGDWLLEQDTSSMEMYRSKVDGVKVEDQDDLTLALAFAGRPNAG
jgi:hypothetical protein